MNVRQINQAVRNDSVLFARGQFRACRVYGARKRKGQRELEIAFKVIDGKVHRSWVPVRGFGMVVDAKDGTFL